MKDLEEVEAENVERADHLHVRAWVVAPALEAVDVREARHDLALMVVVLAEAEDVGVTVVVDGAAVAAIGPFLDAAIAAAALAADLGSERKIRNIQIGF